MIKYFFSIVLFFGAFTQANAADTYNSAKGTLSIPLVKVANTFYSDVVVTLTGVVSVGTASSTYLSYDTFENNQLTIPVVNVDSTTYYNVVVTLGGVVSVGSTCATATSCTSSTSTVYYAPANFASAIAASYTPAALTAASTFSTRDRYMISNTATETATAAYMTIGSTYSATTGYTVASSTVASAPTYNSYLTKLVQTTLMADGYYRLDSHLHPNNSIDADTTDSYKLKFRNNFGKASTLYGYVTFSYDASTKKLQAKKRYTYAYTSATTNGNTLYTGTYTEDTSFNTTGSGYYVNLSSAGVYSLVAASSSATSLYLYNSPIDLGVPTFMNPNLVAFVTNSAAPFLSKTTTASVEGVSGGIYRSVNSTYTNQISTPGSDATTKTNADAFLVTMKAAVEATGEKLRYAPAAYTAFRDALLATKLVSDSIADGAPGQNLVPYVFFTNEKDLTTGKYHPFMVIVSYGNQASPNGLKDIAHPPGDGSGGYSTSKVTRYSNLENYIFTIPMKDYGQVSVVTDNIITNNLWTVGVAQNSTIKADIYTYADIADNGMLIDGSVIFPTFNNVLMPSHLAGELTASGCHVGQGGGGPHCHSDGYQSGWGLSLYNDTDYAGKTHPPLIGFGYDGIALFAKYRTSTDSTLLGYSTALDAFGAHDHDSIGYHYHAHVVSNITYQDLQSSSGALKTGCITTGCSTTLNVLMKGAYVGNTNSIPFFRSNSNFNTNKYMGGTVR